MTKEDLIEFLKSNLEINIIEDGHQDYYKGLTGYDIKVELLLNKEIISRNQISIDIK